MTIGKGLFKRGTRCIQGTAWLPCGEVWQAGVTWTSEVTRRHCPQLHPACRLALLNSLLQSALECLCSMCPIGPGHCVPVVRAGLLEGEGC